MTPHADHFAQESIALVNEARARAGLPRLTENVTLSRVARAYGERMARENFYGHVDPQGRGVGDRIAAAACFLPLSVNPRVSRDLGTRHRAALGLTEENDAVVIVVSEETGHVSLVIAGDIERGLSADALRIRLRALLGGRRHRTARAEPRSSLA